MRIPLIALVLAFCPCYSGHYCVSQEIKIISPGFVVAPDREIPLQVLDIEANLLRQSSISVLPSETVVLKPYKDWDDRPYIGFSATTPGKYTITVTLNHWRQALTDTTLSIKSARPDPLLLAEFETVVSKLAAAYPLRMGSCVVEVAGVSPFPPKPAPQPVPPGPIVQTGKKRITLLLERAETTPELGRLINQLRSNPTAQYLTSKGHTLLVLDDDHPSVSSLAGKVVHRPALVIQTVGNDTVEYSGPTPATPTEFTAILQKYGG